MFNFARGRRMSPILAAMAISGTGFLAGNGLAQVPTLFMLNRLDPGMWELRERDTHGARRQLCIAHGRKLIQVRHPEERCQSFTVEDTAAVVTVQYTCRSSGYGRTRIRFENAGLAQIETQGIVNGEPFDFTAEARRIGACSP